MATSVVLKACGGLGPFSWSKTGNVVLSSTTGTHITVSTNGTPVNNFPGSTAFITIRAYVTRVDNGDCGGGDRFDNIDAYNAPNSPVAGAGHLLYDCTGTLKGVGIASEQDTLHMSGTLCGGGSYNTFSNSGHKNVSTASHNASDHEVWVVVKENGITVTSPHGSVPFTAGTQLTLQALADVRSAAMIAGGCSSCNDPSGATVTVTDAAGVSVTYTF